MKRLYNTISLLLAMLLAFGVLPGVSFAKETAEIAVYSQDAEETQYQIIDIDPGNVQGQMSVGSSQLLTPTIIYMERSEYDRWEKTYAAQKNEQVDPTDDIAYQQFLNWLLIPEHGIRLQFADVRTTDIFYCSFISTAAAVTVNAVGRITAAAIGEADVLIRCDDFEKTIPITVSAKQLQEVPPDSSWPEEPIINENPTPMGKVIDIDPGDYQVVMSKGMNQLLMPTAIYEDFSSSPQAVFSFSSSNTAILTVNALGRVTAVSDGTAVISIHSGDFTKAVSIKVEKEETELAEAKIPVTDLDFGEFEDTLEVGRSLTLSVTVIPATATDAEISYLSSNEKVATVNGIGRVTGVAPGTVRITANAGGVKKSITIKVEVKTEGIKVEESYFVMKPTEERKIEARALPESAPQSLSYTSLDEQTATVSKEGIITAIRAGSTSIVVSNGFSKAVVSVIVNQPGGNTKQDSQAGDTQRQDSGDSRSRLVKEIEDGEDGREYFAYCDELY